MGGARERVRYSDESGAGRRLDINWRNEHGCSAFYIAVVKGHIDAVQTLLQINRDDFDYDLVCPRALRRVAVLGGGAEGRRGDD